MLLIDKEASSPVKIVLYMVMCIFLLFISFFFFFFVFLISPDQWREYIHDQKNIPWSANSCAIVVAKYSSTDYFSSISVNIFFYNNLKSHLGENMECKGYRCSSHHPLSQPFLLVGKIIKQRRPNKKFASYQDGLSNATIPFTDLNWTKGFFQAFFSFFFALFFTINCAMFPMQCTFRVGWDCLQCRPKQFHG